MTLEWRLVALAAAVTALVTAAACGGDPDEEVLRIAPAPSAKAADTEAPPTILDVRLQPSDPHPGESIRAHVRATTTTGARADVDYHWTVGGEPVGGESDSIVVPELRKGARVEVTAVAHDANRHSQPVSVSAEVANRPPRIESLRLEPGESQAGASWRAEVAASDPDDDPIELRYRWLVNDAPHRATGASFPTGLLKGGDRLEVEVIASDGQSESGVAASGEVTVSNASPDIVSVPPPIRGGSDSYTYAVEARDPEGDAPLRFELVKGPEGMQLDPATGVLRWRPTASQSGRHPIEIAVDDRHGGRSTQSFELAIVLETAEGAVPTAPAP